MYQTPLHSVAVARLVGIIGLSLTTVVDAADQRLDSVVVTASRFRETNPGVAGNISIITRQDIRDTPAQNLPDVLAARMGIDVRQLGGVMGRDATVDMRGFGATATNNTLILIDGLRVNPIDSGSIIWSSIPLESIERIEIVRGSGTILYGDGATGGVINIITDKSGLAVAGVSATLGSFGYRGADAQFAGGDDRVYYHLFANYADSRGYRKNSQQDQQAVSGRIGRWVDGGEVFADFAAYQESAGQPGSIFSAAYHDDPRSTRTPRNAVARDGYRLRPGVSYRLTDRLSLEAEAAFERQNLYADYFSGFGTSTSDRLRETVSFTPRLRWRHDLGSLASETVLGFDYYDGKVRSDNVGFANQTANQESSGLYLQNRTSLMPNLSLTLGGRTQRVRQEAHQDAYAPFFSPAVDGHATHTQGAYDVGLSYAGEGWRVYGKTGTSFRFANVDELFGFDTLRFVPVFAGNLKPQHGRIDEFGGSVTFDRATLRTSFFQLDLTDEIGYDDALGANANLSPTRRKGVELEAEWMIATRLQAKASYAYTQAQFRSGAYSGSTVPLVPREQASLQVSWNTGAVGNYAATARYVGSRRYDGDLANAQGMLAGYTTVDLQGVWNIRPWKITAKVLNALDRKYAPLAGYSSFYQDTYYYPADARSFFISGRLDF